MEFPQTPMIISRIIKILPVIIGAAGGYAYYYYIGCASGTCPITSNPFISTAYGSLIGFLISKGSGKDEKAGHDELKKKD